MRPPRAEHASRLASAARLLRGIGAPLFIAALAAACDRTGSMPPNVPPPAASQSSQSGLPPLEDVVRHVKNLGSATLSEEAAARLTFVAIDVPGNMIVGFDEDGTPLGPLATDPAQKFDLAATREGDRIAFVRRFDKPLRRHDVVVMNRDGSDKRLLTLAHPDVAETERRARAGEGRDAPRFENLFFAPDGRSLLLFAQMSNRLEGVYRLAVDGSTLEPVAESSRGEADAVHYRFPCVSNDGLRFACSRRILAEGEGEASERGFVDGIVLVSVADLSATNAYRSATRGPRALAFAPDDSALLCVEADAEGGSRLFILPLSPGGSRATRTLVTGRGLVGSFSPDGRSVVYSAERADSEDLYVVPTEGGEPRRLTRGTSRTREPIWLPPRK